MAAGNLIAQPCVFCWYRPSLLQLALGPLNALRTFLAGGVLVLGSGSLICLPLSHYEKRKLFHTPGETREKKRSGKKAQADSSWAAGTGVLQPGAPGTRKSQQVLPWKNLRCTWPGH